MVRALLMSSLKKELMNCLRVKLNFFPRDIRSVDIKTSKCEE